MIPINRKPTTLAQKMSPEHWRNIADCAYARHQASARAECYSDCNGHWQAYKMATAQAELAGEPFPIKVADGIRHYGKFPTWDDLLIDRDWHLDQAINGNAISLPDYLDSAVSDEDKGWRDKVCAYLKATDDRNRDYTWDRLDIAGEHDLTGDVEAVAFTPSDCGDRFWSKDTFVVCDGKLRKLDGTIGDSCILNDRIGWYVASLQDGEYLAECEAEAQRYSAGYSGNPTRELERDLIGEPVWHYGLGCFTGRLRYWPEPVRLNPVTPCYGG